MWWTPTETGPGELTHTIPLGNFGAPAPLRTAADLGQAVRAQRQALQLRQVDLAGIGNTGNRLIVDIEKGKPTVQLQKMLDVLELLGLEVMVRSKASRSAL